MTATATVGRVASTWGGYTGGIDIPDVIIGDTKDMQTPADDIQSEESKIVFDEIENNITRASENRFSFIVTPTHPKVLRSFVGFVEDYGEESAIIKLWHGEVEFRRAFKISFLSSFGIREEGQPLEMTIVMKQGEPVLTLQPLEDAGDRRIFQIVEGLDYSQFKELDG